MRSPTTRVSSKDVYSGQAGRNVSIGAGTKLQHEKLVQRIGALCAAQKNKKRMKRRKAA